MNYVIEWEWLDFRTEWGYLQMNSHWWIEIEKSLICVPDILIHSLIFKICFSLSPIYFIAISFFFVKVVEVLFSVSPSYKTLVWWSLDTFDYFDFWETPLQSSSQKILQGCIMYYDSNLGCLAFFCYLRTHITMDGDLISIKTGDLEYWQYNMTVKWDTSCIWFFVLQ